MRLRETIWATAALAAAGLGYLAGTGNDPRPSDDQYTAIPLCSEEECDGPRLTHAEPIDLSCIESVLPFDLFAHTSEPPLAGPVTPSPDLRPVGFEFPFTELPSLPHIPSAEREASPAMLPAGVEQQGTELPDPQKKPGDLVQTSGQLPASIRVEIAAAADGCPNAGHCPCCVKIVAESPVKPLPPDWFVGPPAPDGWIGPE